MTYVTSWSLSDPKIWLSNEKMVWIGSRKDEKSYGNMSYVSITPGLSIFDINVVSSYGFKVLIASKLVSSKN